MDYLTNTNCGFVHDIDSMEYVDKMPQFRTSTVYAQWYWYNEFGSVLENDKIVESVQ